MPEQQAETSPSTSSTSLDRPMTSVPHALRRWWRYSKLTFFPFGSTAIVVLCLWGSALLAIPAQDS